MIVDDEPIAHRILESYLQDHPRVELIYSAYNTYDARQCCELNPVDLLLLDIQMPEETGLDFLRNLEKRPVTIFTTAHLDYALEGFELGVMDYLVKPIRRERFDAALKRAIEFLDLQQLQSILRSPDSIQETIEIQSGTKSIALPLAGISHVQGLKDYAIIYTPERRHVLRMTMKNLEQLLTPHGFVRVHKSFIVAANRLPLIHRQKIEFDGFQIPVGRRFRGFQRYSPGDSEAPGE